MKILTLVGLSFDIIGVGIIFWSSKKVESPTLSDALGYWGFQRKAKWGLGLVLLGFVCQLVSTLCSP